MQAISDRGLLTPNLDLVFVLLWTFITGMFVFIPPLAYSLARPIAGLIFIFIVPSYALIAALFPEQNRISGFERMMLVLGMGFPIISLIGLGLGFSQWGAQLNSIAISASIFTFFCVVVAGVRRRSLPLEERFFVRFERVAPLKDTIFPRSEGRLDKTLSVVLVIAIVAAASALTFAIVAPKQGERLTEFYLLGPNGQAGNYSTNYSLGEQEPTTVGIVNHEYQTETYNLVVKLNDSNQSTTLYSQNVTLADNQSFVKQIEIKPDRIGNDMKLEFLLYLDNSNVPYEETHLWINVTR
jgi:uncharacterized membrane protein